MSDASPLLERLPLELQRHIFKYITQRDKSPSLKVPDPSRVLALLALADRRWARHVWALLHYYTVKTFDTTTAIQYAPIPSSDPQSSPQSGRFRWVDLHIADCAPGISVWWEIEKPPPDAEWNIIKSLRFPPQSSLSVVHQGSRPNCTPFFSFLPSLANITSLSLYCVPQSLRTKLLGSIMLRKLKFRRTLDIWKTESPEKEFPRVLWSSLYPSLTHLSFDTNCTFDFEGLGGLFPRLHVLRVDNLSMAWKEQSTDLNAYYTLAKEFPLLDWSKSFLYTATAGQVFGSLTAVDSAGLRGLWAAGVRPPPLHLYKDIHNFQSNLLNQVIERVALLFETVGIPSTLDDDLQTAIKRFFAHPLNELQVEIVFRKILAPFVAHITARSKLRGHPAADLKRRAVSAVLDWNAKDYPPCNENLDSILRCAVENQLDDVWNDDSVELLENFFHRCLLLVAVRRLPRLIVPALRGGRITEWKLTDTLAAVPRALVDHWPEVFRRLRKFDPDVLFRAAAPLISAAELQQLKRDVLVHFAENAEQRFNVAWKLAADDQPGPVDKAFIFHVLAAAMMKAPNRLIIFPKIRALAAKGLGPFPTDPTDGRSLLHLPLPLGSGELYMHFPKEMVLHRDNLGRTGLHFLVAQASTDPKWADDFAKYCATLASTGPLDCIEDVLTSTDYCGVGLSDYAPEEMRPTVSDLIAAELAKTRAKLPYRFLKLYQGIISLLPFGSIWLQGQFPQ